MNITTKHIYGHVTVRPELCVCIEATSGPEISLRDRLMHWVFWFGFAAVYLALMAWLAYLSPEGFAQGFSNGFVMGVAIGR